MHASSIAIGFHDRNAVKEACNNVGVRFDDFCAAYTVAIGKNHGYNVVASRRNKANNIELVFEKI